MSPEYQKRPTRSNETDTQQDPRRVNALQRQHSVQRTHAVQPNHQVQQHTSQQQDVAAFAPGAIKLFNWVFKDDELKDKKGKSVFKVGGSLAILMPKQLQEKVTTGTALDNHLKLSRSSGTGTVAEINTPKGKKLMSKYSSKLFDAGLAEGKFAGLTFKISMGFAEFKTSLDDAKKLKSNSQKNLSKSENAPGKGVMGLGFDFDLLNVAISVSGTLDKSNQDNPLFSLISGNKVIAQVLNMGGKLEIKGEIKVSPTGWFGEYAKIKKHKEALKNLEASAERHHKVEQEVNDIKKRRDKVKDLHKRMGDYKKKMQNDDYLKGMNKHIKKLEQEQRDLNKQLRQSQKAKKRIAKQGAKAPAKSYARAQGYQSSKPLSNRRKNLVESLKKSRETKARMEKNIAKEFGIPDKVPDRSKLMQEKRILEKNLVAKEAELLKVKETLKGDITKVQKMSTQYSSKFGKLLGKRVLVGLARLVAHLNIIMDVIDGLAFILAYILAPERASTIFSSKNTVSAIELITLLATDSREGDKEKGGGTTNIRKSGSGENTTTQSNNTTNQGKTNTGGKKKEADKKNAKTKKTGLGGVKSEEIRKILDQNETAAELVVAFLFDDWSKRKDKVAFAKFTTAHAKELVRICKKYEGKLNIKETLRGKLKELNEANKGDINMGQYLEMIEGVLTRATDSSVTGQSQKTLNVDKENQFVVHDKGVEKEKKFLGGSAKKIRTVPVNSVTYKPEGRYIITGVEDASYPVGTELELRFRGSYYGQKADFTNIIVEIVASPIKRNGHKYVKVKFPYSQSLFIESINKRIYFSVTTKSFYVQIN